MIQTPVAGISMSMFNIIQVSSVAGSGLIGSKSFTCITSSPKMVAVVPSLTDSGLSGSSLCFGSLKTTKLECGGTSFIWL